jgi:hypothetical protein
MSAAELSRRMPDAVTIDPIDDHTCLARVGSDSPEMLTHYLTMLGADLDVVDPPELRGHLRALGERLLRAAEPPGDGDGTPNQRAKPSRPHTSARPRGRRPG